MTRSSGLSLLWWSSPVHWKGGHHLWAQNKKNPPAGFATPDHGFDAKQYMPFHRFKSIRSYVSYMFRDPSGEKSDWSEIRAAVEGFNAKQRLWVSAAGTKVLDEIMSAWCPQKTKTGGLPHLSYISRKPKPLGKHISKKLCSHFYYCLPHNFIFY